MKHTHRLAWPLVLLVLGAFALSACGDREAAEPDAIQTTESVSALRVTEVELGSSINADRSVNAMTSRFAPTDTIYASVTTQGSGSGTLTARWEFEDDQVVDETTQSISPSGTGHTEFHISMPEGLPAGSYTVEILLDGESAATESFEIQ